MNRRTFWVWVVLACLIVPGGADPLAHQPRAAAESPPPALGDLAWVTAAATDVLIGCTPIGVLRTDIDEPVYSAPVIAVLTWRLAATHSLDLVLAPGLVPYPAGTGSWGLYGLRRNGPTWTQQARPIAITTSDSRPCGGIAIMPDDETLLFGHCPAVAKPHQFAVRRYRLSEMHEAGGAWQLGQMTGDMPFDSLPAEIVASSDGIHAHVVSEDMSVRTIDVRTMSESLPSIAMASVDVPFVARAGELQGLISATVSPDERYLVTGRGLTDKVNVADLVDRRSWTITAGAGITRTLGVAFDRAQRNYGRLAIHACSQVLVDDFAADGTLREVGRATLPRRSVCGGNLLGRLAWSGSGADVIAASFDRGGSTMWAVLSVDEATGRVAQLGNIGHCTGSPPFPAGGNDVLTANRYIPAPTPSPTPTATLSPSPTPSQRPSPSASSTPTASATCTATATQPPLPVYLPIALRERCMPGTQRIDVALVIDASTTMRDGLTSAGRPKLSAAIDAARSFVATVSLPQDQVAVVVFNDQATVLQMLTGRGADVEAALAAIPRLVRLQTRIDLGIEEAHEELTSARRKAANQPVMVVLTDGLANPVPASTAVRRAQTAKDDHITIFTIGLGQPEALDVVDLREMASRPDYFYLAPDGEDLMAIYHTIAVTIPCPPEDFWGRR